LLLSRSQIVSFPDGTSFVFPLFHNLPRTGGVSVQMGTVLGIGVGQPPGNTVQATDDDKGDLPVEWNGGPTHSFTGIKSTVIQAQRAKSDQITFNLTSSRTSPTAVAVGSHLPTDTASAKDKGHFLQIVDRLRTSGSAVQTGSVLTVMVNRSRTNTVEISNSGGGAVAVEWNGGAAHSFMGVATIVVDTQNARKDLVALNDVAG
jgi:hypothetical protein